jgi:hypothetical protein
MPYVQRDSDGKVIARYAQRQAGYADEFLADDAPDILAADRAAADALLVVERRMRKRERLVDQLLDSNKPLDQIRAEIAANDALEGR